MKPRTHIEVGRIDRSAPMARTEEGLPVFRVRCKIPFTFDCPVQPRVRTPAQPAQRAEGDGPDGQTERGVIEGIASSTSVDWYGTRMDLQALVAMQAQFQKGVDYFPRHHSYSSAVEWSEVIGRTIDARIERAEVKEPKNPAEVQHLLHVTTQLDVSEELSQKLLRRIEAGKGPGQSIGGWFTELQVTYSDDDEYKVEDIVILDVELDHLAAVRSPANPDAEKTYKALAAGLGEQVQRGLPSPAGVQVEEIADGFRLSVDDEPAIQAIEVAADLQPEGRSVPQAAVPTAADPSTEATPPRTDAATQAREIPQEYVMDPKELQALIDAGVARALQAQADARAAAPVVPAAPVVTGPTQAEQDLANERAARIAAEARANAAEAMIRAQAAAPATRAGAQPTEAPAPASRDLTPITGPGGIDLRAVAPRAVKAAARAGDKVTPGLVLVHDGMRAIVAIAKGEGATNIAELAASDELLTSTSKGAVRALAARYGNRDAPAEDEARMDRTGLEDLLTDVVRAAVDDGLITPPSRYASWQ